MDAICRFGVEATLVANEFIDRYMADANGEYVKVYLYLLRHHQEKLDVGQIADALNHTEADVRRALSYWEKLGALTLSSPERSAMENQGAIWRDSDSRKSSIQPAASDQAGGRAESDQSGQPVRRREAFCQLEAGAPVRQVQRQRQPPGVRCTVRIR